ncbi:MAG: T9SS type A sorting domain-containing protein [Bacteroidia bacterium]
MKKSFNLILLFIFFFSSANATHIMGGAFDWECLGGDSFKVNLTLYRDCNGVSIQNTQNTNIYVGTDTIRLRLTQVSTNDITYLCDGEYSRCDTSTSFKYGVQNIVYSGVLHLSKYMNSTACMVEFTWGSCCRSGAITTGSANEGMYINAQMNICVNPCGSSPKWTKKPKNLLCYGRDEMMDFGTINATYSDSIYFVLDSALQSSTQSIDYTSPYNYLAPFYHLGFPANWKAFPRGFHLDSTNGAIMFRGMKRETSVIKVRAKLYHKGKFYGFATRELQTTARICQNTYPSVIMGIDGKFDATAYKAELCPGDTLAFPITTRYGSGDTTWLGVKGSGLPPEMEIEKSKYESSRDTVFFYWAPKRRDANNYPYTFVASALNNACPIAGNSARSFAIYVRHPHLDFVNKYQLNNTCGLYSIKTTESNGRAHETINWYIDNQLVSNADSFGFEFKTTGSHIIKFEHIGCADTVIIDTINVDIANNVNVVIAQDSLFCGDEIATIKPNISGGTAPYNYLWNVGNIQPYSGPLKRDSIAIDLKNELLFRRIPISLHITDSNGCIDSLKFNLHSLRVRRDEISGNYEYCQNENKEIEFDRFDNKYGYWTGNKINNNKVKIKQLSAGIHEYNYFYKQTYQCYRDTAVIEIKPVTYAFAGNNQNTCITTNQIELTGVPAGGKWNGTTITDSTFYPSQAKKGKHKLIYKFTNKYGCIDKDTLVVTVTNEKENIILSGNTTECEGDSFTTIGAQPSGGFWVAKGLVSYDDTLKYQIDQLPVGEYWIKYVIDDSIRCKSEDSLMITIKKNPFAQVGFEYNDSVVYHNEEFTAVFTGTNRAVDQYAFYISDSLMQSGNKRKFTYQISKVGEHTIGLVVIDTTEMCTSKMANTTLYVEQDASISNGTANSFELYPNPVGNQLYIKSTNGLGIIKIYALNGKVLYEAKTENNTLKTIDFSEFANGSYKVEFSNSKGVHSKTIVKK